MRAIASTLGSVFLAICELPRYAKDLSTRDSQALEGEADAERQALFSALNVATRLLENTRDGMVAFDRNCRYVFWNHAMEGISGVPAKDLLGRHAFEVFPFLIESGEDQCFYEALAGRTATSKAQPFDVEEVQKQGQYDAFYAPLRDPGGDIIGGIAIVRETTEHQLALLRLEEAEGRFQSIADIAPVLLWMADKNGQCFFFNAPWLAFTGRTMAQQRDLGWLDDVHEDDITACQQAFDHALQQPSAMEIEHRLRRHDGEYRWVLHRAAPRFTRKGRFVGLVGSCVDITEQKQLEARLREAISMRDTFLATAAHELRTPLTAARLQTTTLLRALSKTLEKSPILQKALAATDALDQQVQRLAKLVDVLLDVPRLAGGKVLLEREAFDLWTLTQEVVARFQEMAANAKCTLEVHGTPGAAGHWDRLRLDQVLSNLVSNALKYGAGTPVRLDVTTDDNWVRVRTADRGIGISRDNAERIFQRFERAVPTRNYPGLGLGLWICRQITESMGGRIYLGEQSGPGAVFVLEVPRTPPPSKGSALNGVQ